MIVSILGSLMGSALLTVAPSLLLAASVSILFSLALTLPQILAVWGVILSINLLIGQFFMIRRATTK